ncbi:MAG TPA: ATP-dependent helicase HrpB, partial [Gemmatimonadaceae bacterium]|nr:ATP-dependent helicase HrpB [Gemmatimonadaceae bacterium]
SLSGEEQDRALSPAPRGRRKVVLATSIAETSVTIEGVRIVVDGGLARGPRFDPNSGMTRLETTRVSRASAEQRRGRAGRTAPGVCYRLWAEHDDHGLVAQSPPEILVTDLTPLALELAVAGIADADELRWLTAPPSAALAQARELLRELGALEPDGRVSPHGRAMTRLPAHPRLAHMLLAAGTGESLALASQVAALLLERDVVRAERAGVDADIALRVELLRAGRDAAPPGLTVDRDALRRAHADARNLAERARAARGGGGRSSSAAIEPLSVGALVALAYPDRVARRRARQPGRYLTRAGGGAMLAAEQSLTGAEFIAIADLDGRRGESRIYLAASLGEQELRTLFGGDITTEDSVAFDEEAGVVQARRVERLGAIVLADAAVRDPDEALVGRAFVEAVRRRGIASLPWSEGARRLRERLAFVHALDPDWPDVSDEALGATLDVWLAPHLGGMRRLEDLRRLDLGALLLDAVGWRRRAALDELAPTHHVVPSGSRIPIDYADPRAPVLAVRLQEMFGLAETPRVGGGRVPLTLHLLSPAQRPVQVTRDLAGFWRTSYFDVRKDLRGRYPKHHWPENPLEATPTRRAK